MGVLHVLLWLCSLSIADGQLHCYNCNNIEAIGDCNTTRWCGMNEHCFTELRGQPGKRTFDSGCRTETECLALKPDPSISFVGKRSTSLSSSVCNQCCGVNLCNNKLCATTNHAPLINATCEDDPTFDCERMSGLLNLCTDIPLAKTVCRKFCGLCKLIDGNWSRWTAWSTCSVTCDSGTSTRSRTCNNSAPAYGGQDCIGQNLQTQACHKQQCPVHGGWTKWLPWGTCSVTCGMGLQKRERNCSNPLPSLDGQHCFGDARDYRTCYLQACIDGGWSQWSDWNTCSHTCDAELTKRHRQCDNPTPSTFGRECQGDANDVKLCSKTDRCPVDGYWSQWGEYIGRYTTENVCQSTRTCVGPLRGGTPCSGESEKFYVPAKFGKRGQFYACG